MPYRPEMTLDDWRKSNGQISWHENFQQTKGMRTQPRPLYYCDLESLGKPIATWESYHILNLGILQQILDPGSLRM